MKFATLIAPFAIIAIGTLAPRLFSATTPTNLGLLGNDAERVVIRELAQRLTNTPNTRPLTLNWSEDNGSFHLQCRAYYEPAQRRLISYTDRNKIEFFPVTPESLQEIARYQDGSSFANAKKLSLRP